MTVDTLQPLVSVCIPTYNRADRLARAIASLQASTYSNLEIIISDNASTDHTEETCRTLAAADSRIRYYRHPVNRGPTHNFNFAKTCATGKYFLWHSDDDHLSNSYVEHMVRTLEFDPYLVLASGRASYTRSDGSEWVSNFIPLQSRFRTIRIIRYLAGVRDNAVFYGLYRRRDVAHLELGNFLWGDCSWVVSVLACGPAVMIQEERIFREHLGTTSSSVEKICRTLGLPDRHAKWKKFFILRNLIGMTSLGLGDREFNSIYSLWLRLVIGATLIFRYPIQIVQKLFDPDYMF